jgi:hypothetical protein
MVQTLRKNAKRFGKQKTLQQKAVKHLREKQGIYL